MDNPLDYLRASPVRGQLEPYDPHTPPGWRFIQTTDTLNELKVLLPPGTAAMYEQLLKLESYELSKKSISWDRILEIRHLKDRMIRKCQKLVKQATPGPRPIPSFRTYVSPPDFRVKEMEKWFREQHKRFNAAAARRASAPPQAGQSKPLAPGPQPTSLLSSSTAIPPVSSKTNLQRSTTNTLPKSSTSKSGLYSKAQALINATRAIKPERTTSLPITQVQPVSTREFVISPPPLPILLRGQRSVFGLDDELGAPESDKGDPELPESVISEPPLPPPSKESPPNESAIITPSSSGDEQTLPTSRSLPRRRSCIKRGSMSELGAKTVSWADDTELENHVSRYASTARDAQASGRQWEEIRTIYLEQIDGLENLELQVREGLDNLKAESEQLKRVDETIRRQRDQLRQTLEKFELKQNLFNDKVKLALEHADGVMSRQGIRKDSHLIAND